MITGKVHSLTIVPARPDEILANLESDATLHPFSLEIIKSPMQVQVTFDGFVCRSWLDFWDFYFTTPEVWVVLNPVDAYFGISLRTVFTSKRPEGT